MKKIINGRKYDTETAELVASYGYSNVGDFHYWEEDLYRTKFGNWFIVGSGGPMSMYCESANGNTWGLSNVFKPIDPNDAMEWLEQYAEDTEALEKYFSKVIEDA